MAKILVGYEWGLGMGHLARMLPIARALIARDHQVVFFLYHPGECARAFAAEQLPVIPVMRIFARIPEMGTLPRFNSYSDVISSICGYYPENLYMRKRRFMEYLSRHGVRQSFSRKALSP